MTLRVTQFFVIVLTLVLVIIAAGEMTKPNKKNAADRLELKGKALSLFEDGEYLLALEYFDELVTLEPSDPWCYSHRAEIYFEQGRYGDSVAEYTKAIELGLTDARHYNVRGVSHYNLDNFNVLFRLYDA